MSRERRVAYGVAAIKAILGGVDGGDGGTCCVIWPVGLKKYGVSNWDGYSEVFVNIVRLVELVCEDVIIEKIVRVYSVLSGIIRIYYDSNLVKSQIHTHPLLFTIDPIQLKMMSRTVIAFVDIEIVANMAATNIAGSSTGLSLTGRYSLTEHTVGLVSVEQPWKKQ